MITVFENYYAKELYYRDIDRVLDNIRNCTIQGIIDKIRQEQDKEKRSRLKRNLLPCILFAGKFTYRNSKSCVEHSGFAIMDFDHLENIYDKKQELIKFPFVYSVFISPSGDGLKVVVRIPADIERHKGHYLALLKVFPDADTTSQDICRICFQSCDKDIYVNVDAVEFTDYMEEAPKEKLPPREFIKNDYDLGARAAKIIRNAADGQKHEALLSASRLMGGFIAGGLMEEHLGISILESEIQGRNINDFDGAKKTIRDGIAYGKENPIYEEVKDISTEQIMTSDPVWDRMKWMFVHGKSRGLTTHFPDFDKNFTWKKGEITLIIGKPNHGKTEFMLHLMLLKSIIDGWKWAVFSPENYPIDEFYDTIIHGYVGQSTDPYYSHNQMSLKQYRAGYEFAIKHFFYVYPDRHTIEDIDAQFRYYIENKKINGTFLDPFNQIEAVYGLRDDHFLSTFLSERKRVAIEYGLCDVISSHPKSMMRNKNGGNDVPDIYDIAMGAMWGNKMDNIMVIDRPNYHTDPYDTTVDIHVRKIKKQKLVGVPGICRFTFDRTTNRYYHNNFSPLETQPRIPENKFKPMPRNFNDTDADRDNSQDF